MADSKIRLNESWNHELRASLSKLAILKISEKTGLLIMQKINMCNAKEAVSFASAFCSVSRPKASTDRPVEIYSLGSVYRTGWNILNEFLKYGNEPKHQHNWSALKALVDYIEGKEWIDLAKRMRRKDWSKTKVTMILLHHCMSKLAVSRKGRPPYTVDNYKNKMSNCPCCMESIAGELDDTSIGNTEVWHGQIDAIVGGNVCITSLESHDADQTLDQEDNESLSSASSYSAIVEMKKDSLEKEIGQVLAQTITFSFLQYSKQPDQVPLYPTISVSNRNIQFHFFDSVNDILLSSPHHFELFDYMGNLDFTVIVSLWFILNHSLFCTGVTQEMKDYSFTADFLKGEEEIKDIYRNKLEFPCGPGKHDDWTDYMIENLQKDQIKFRHMIFDDEEIPVKKPKYEAVSFGD